MIGHLSTRGGVGAFYASVPPPPIPAPTVFRGMSGCNSCKESLARLPGVRLRRRGIGSAADAIPGQSWGYYGTPDMLLNAFWYGPLNSLGLVSGPLTQDQLNVLAQQEAASRQKAKAGVPLTPQELAKIASDVTGASQITPDVVDLSALTGIIPKAGSVNWILILGLLAGGGFVAYKVFQGFSMR